ncbi:uncharacterized protein EAF01_003892 [Botrytis porri]|uniref:uncharacterized protein n=1 Tax=Botrytis porri TaxID=87229 RepID=UPI0018FFA789|nr:uncharacterized protein EAF01_003892 [Botrytis porri]KAF7908137.1 hypothetical protein EAF01_003892 [Botrytis porri]
MSTPVTKAFHMEKVELSGPRVDAILSQLGEWLPNAKFELDGKVEKCADAELDHRCRPLFIELDILRKISSQQIRKKYNVIRILSQEPVEFYSSVGETDLIPIHLLTKSNTKIAGRTNSQRRVRISRKAYFRPNQL